MVVAMPTDLAGFEAGLSIESLNEVVDSLAAGVIQLQLPRWTARTEASLDEVLSALGTPTAFSSAADFSAMVTGETRLQLSAVVHQAFIEVDEHGTEAAAATGVIEEAVEERQQTFIEIDRPFLYLIRNPHTGTILFIGRITDPTLAT